MATRGLGRAGEEAAARALARAGYRVLERNARAPGGEIDLVAEHAGEIVFVEVKARASVVAGGPAEAVSASKQRRLARVAEAYLALRGLEGRPCRFDVVAVTLDARGRPQVEILRDAIHLDRMR